MPAQYAHNKFGKLVIANLPQEEKYIIQQYPDAFRIGLQGPDYLFFYRAFCKNKVNQTGVYYHHHDAYPFFTHALDVVNQYGKDSGQYSYILGFICHFALDNACHPYVNSFMNHTKCGHIEIEGDLDQLILSSEDFVPEYYPLHFLVPAHRYVARAMSPFYEELSWRTIFSSLKWMKSFKRFFVAPDIIKRSTIDLVIRLTFHYKKLNGHVIQPTANKRCRKETKFLYKLLKNSVSNAVSLIDEFNNALQTGTLPDEFHKDFNGNSFC